MVLPLLLGIGAGNAVAGNTGNTWLSWLAGAVVFFVAASIGAAIYRRIRPSLPTPSEVEHYYEKHNERVQHRAIFTTINDGVDPDLAMLHAHALLPPIGEIGMTGFKQYYKEVNRAAWAYGRQWTKARKRDASRHELEDLTLDALNRYAVIGQRRNDTWLPQEMDRIIRNYTER